MGLVLDRTVAFGFPGIRCCVLLSRPHSIRVRFEPSKLAQLEPDLLFASSKCRSAQHPVTCIITAVFSGFSCLGLVTVSAWFLSERWVFLTHNGKKWLADAISESGLGLSSVPGITGLSRIHKTAFRPVILKTLQRFINFLELLRSRFQPEELDEEFRVGVEAPSVASAHSPMPSRTFSLARQNTQNTHPSITVSFAGTSSQTHDNPNTGLAIRPLTPIPASPISPTSGPLIPSSIARRRWQNAIESYSTDPAKNLTSISK